MPDIINKINILDSPRKEQSMQSETNDSSEKCNEGVPVTYGTYIDEFDIDNVNEKMNENVHIRLKQRNAKKTITTVEGLDSYLDKEKIDIVLKSLRKELSSGGTKIYVKDDKGVIIKTVLQFQGDDRDKIYNFLVTKKIIEKDYIKIHGF